MALLEKWKDSLLKENIWAITNNQNSTLAERASMVFPTIAGEETSVTSKTYVTGILVHFLISNAIIGHPILKSSEIKELKEMITRIENDMEGDWENWGFFKLGTEIHEFLGDLSFLNYIGTGTSMATVMQGCLNFKEITKTYAEGLSIGMFRHGPIETISPDFRAIILTSDEKALTSAIPVSHNITTRWGKGKVVLITNSLELLDGNQDEIENKNILLIKNPIKNPYLAPIYEIIILQQHMCIQAIQKGFEPGEFINSQKITR